jgi:hypothetical protein
LKLRWGDHEVANPREYEMKLLVAAAAMFAASITGTMAEVVSLEFNKDSCDKFEKS